MRRPSVIRAALTVIVLTTTFAVGTGPASAAPPGTNSQAAEAAACASLYGVPVAGNPDPLSPCQWDMRAIGATASGSYAVNRGRGARVGDIDTGIDLTNSDIMPNVDLAASCDFIYADTPTSNPAEQVTRGDCSNKSALQDLAGHGTHTAGTIAAPINGMGTSGVAPEATIVVLKAGTEQGFFFTQSVVDALMYAGNQHLDVVNMSFFADPWLFNCRNDQEHRHEPPHYRRDQPGLPPGRRGEPAGQQQLHRPADRAAGRRRGDSHRCPEPAVVVLHLRQRH